MIFGRIDEEKKSCSKNYSSFKYRLYEFGPSGAIDASYFRFTLPEPETILPRV